MFLLPLNQAQSDDENLRDEDLGQQEEKKSGECKDKNDKVFNLRTFAPWSIFETDFFIFIFRQKWENPRDTIPLCLM